MSVRFLFVPETIGSICYLSHHEDLIPNLKAGIFADMTGNENSILIQRSRQDTHLIDKISQYVLQKNDEQFRQAPFRDIGGNDEMVINGPGVNVPCVSVMRWPYNEYHTSADNLDIIHESFLVECADVIEEIVRIFCSNYIPHRLFKGPLFLSGHGLWIQNLTDRLLNEKIMLRLDGNHSVFDIARETRQDYWYIRTIIEKMFDKGVIEKYPIPSQQNDFGEN